MAQLSRASAFTGIHGSTSHNYVISGIIWVLCIRVYSYVDLQKLKPTGLTDFGAKLVHWMSYAYFSLFISRLYSACAQESDGPGRQ